jgi:hypothetical protein
MFMTDIATLREIWKEREEVHAVPMLTRQGLTDVVRRRARAARDGVTTRMWAELVTYAAMTAAVLLILIVKRPPHWVASIALVMAFLGATSGVMFVKRRSLRQVSLDGTLHEALIRMIGIFSGWMTFYMTVYMVTIVGLCVMALATLAHDTGMRSGWWLAAGGSAVVMAWSYLSGRTYMRREFEGHRDELQRALADLEAP